MQIILNYDSSVATNPQEAAFKQALTVAVNNLDTLITNDITVNIGVGWGEVNGTSIAGATLGEAQIPAGVGKSTYFYDITNRLNAITNQSPIQQEAYSSLYGFPDPSAGSGTNFEIYPAQEKALGMTVTGTIDGYVGFSKTASFNFGTVETAVTGEYDFIGDAEHELTHVLGRISQQEFNPGKSGVFSILDLFRYKSPGTLAIGNSGSAYFSLDNGTTDLINFDPTTGTSGDRGDWGHGGGADAFNQVVATGTVLPLTSIDVDMLNVLGFSVLCFCSGTLIRTPHGDVAVERLAVGDEVVTWSGDVRRITWIGIGRVRPKRGERGPATPVIVRKAALGDRVPKRDLRVTKGHSLLIDGVLIPVEELVNHRSILWDDNARDVAIYHVELETHDVLVANGAPAESYRDDGNRWLFQNMNSRWDGARQAPCAPLLHDGPQVNAIWRRLLERAGKRPGLPLTDDADLHLTIDGARIDAVERGGDAHVFRLPARCGEVRLMSRTAVPQELGLARDPRALGVAVRRLVVASPARGAVAMEAEDTRLADGYHAFEPRDAIRWTRGDAAVPGELLAGMRGAGRLEVWLGGAVPYVDC